MQDNARQCLIIFLFALLGACTPDEAPLNTENGAEEEIAQRSTQAECDSLEESLDSAAQDQCDIAELYECRLNQGVDEAFVIQNCDFMESHNFNYCIPREDIEDDYQMHVDDNKMTVVNNTDECPPTCSDPDPILGCRTVIFQVNCTGSCGPGMLQLDITAFVYCCD